MRKYNKFLRPLKFINWLNGLANKLYHIYSSNLKQKDNIMTLVKKSVITAFGTALLCAVLTSGVAMADTNPFAAKDLMTVALPHESGKCGESKDKEADDKCGEAKMKAKHDGKCGEGKCGEAKMKAMAEMKAKHDGKCGEGKCGEAKMNAKREGKCGEDKQQTKKCGQ
jgi:uncharacterized low-complexity protein